MGNTGCGCFPSEDWLSGVEDTTEKFKVWLMDGDWSRDNSSSLSSDCLYTCTSVSFLLPPPLTHPVVQLAGVALGWVSGSFSGTGVEADEVRRSSSRRGRWRHSEGDGDMVDTHTHIHYPTETRSHGSRLNLHTHTCTHSTG